MGDITDFLLEKSKGAARVNSANDSSIASIDMALTKAAPRANTHIEPGTYSIDGYEFTHRDSTKRPIYTATKGGTQVFLKGAYGNNIPQLRQEASTLTKRLDEHLHICRPVDYIRNIENSPFQGYEFMILPHGGETLETVVSKGITTDDALTILIQVGSAITHAHSKSVIHRDIKPTNIVVDRVDDNYQSMVIDFGIGGHLDEAIFLNQFRGYGTPVYVSPEQENRENPSFASDIYGLCATAVLVLTGLPPFAEKCVYREDSIPIYVTDRNHRKFSPGHIKDEWGKFGSHIINGLSEDPGERPKARDFYLSAMILKRKRGISKLQQQTRY
ncbi:MAG: protein kinase [Nanoarchaeota archaeon]|nr:protein kinase [Nanoarchaeota archaeon]